MSDIHKIETRLRDLVNATRQLHSLYADKVRWNIVCSAMDVIGDTELAIQEYDKIRKVESNHGGSYLIVYGILQIMFVQQDAVRNLAKALGLEFDLPTELIEIRDLRTAFIGHPTEHRRGGIISSGYISRPTLNPSGFQFLRTSSTGPDQWGYVNIPELIVKQYNRIRELLGKAVTHESP